MLAALVASPHTERSSSYEDLVALFTDWRAFQKPKLSDGVPDYSAPAMAAQHKALAGLPAPARRHRSARLARRPAGRLAHRPGRDERARLRPPRAAGRGRTTRPSTSRCFPTRERSAGARGPHRVRRGRDLELHVSAVGRRCRADGRRHPGRFPRCSSRRRRTCIGDRQRSLDATEPAASSSRARISSDSLRGRRRTAAR